MTKPLGLALALAFAAPACGKVVALDDGRSDSAPVVESDEEGVVAILHEEPDLLVNDGDRLYWAGYAQTRPTVSAPSEWVTTIRSCRKADCAGSVIAYATAPFMRWLEVAAGEVYFRLGDQNDLTGTTVLSCPTSGCTGDPRVVVEAANAFTIAGDSIFFGSIEAEPPGIYQKPLRGGDATLVVEVDNPISRILVQSDQLFWSSSGNSNESVLQRTSLSGERRIETLVDGSWSQWDFSLTSDAQAVYWSRYELSGDIERCPLAGCPSGPEIVAAPVRMPTSLLASNGRLYLNVELESSEVGLVSCSPLDCANPKLLGTATGRGRSTIAADERFVYAFSNQGFHAETASLPMGEYDELSSLRRYEK